MPENSKISVPDLRPRPPRSPRCRPGRATITGKNGEFNYDAPFDLSLLNVMLPKSMAGLWSKSCAGKMC